MRKPRLAAGILGTAIVLGISGAATVATAEDAAGGDVRLIVGFKPGSDAGTSIKSLKAAGARVAQSQRLSRISAQRLSVPGRNLDRLKERLRADPRVEFVQVDRVVHKMADVTPNDERFGQQSELPQINVPAAWGTTTGSSDVTVAVVDSGVTAVGDLADAVLPGYDFVNGKDGAADDDGHGTEVASLIAARGDNTTGIAGVCWTCKILPVKVLDKWGMGRDSVSAEGIVYAADRGAQVINLSWGAVGESPALQRATDYARSKGAVVIASAGNDLRPEPNYPAANAGVLAVGGTDANNARYSAYDPGTEKDVGSNYGSSWVDLAAPYCPTSMDPAGTYAARCGNSYSTALVSGVAALVRSHNPQQNVWAQENALTSTAQPLSGDWVRYGQVRADQAVPGVDRTPPTVTGATPGYRARVRGTVTVTATGVDDTGGSGFSHVWLYADGRWIGSDSTAPYSVPYSTAGRNGVVRLQWKVFDKAGNTAVLNRDIIADNTPPSLKVTSAPKSGKKVGKKVTIKATASDAAGVKRVEVWVNGKLKAWDWTGPYSITLHTRSLPKKFKVVVKVSDKVGNVRSSATYKWTR